MEVSWSKPCYAKCFPAEKHHADKWQQQKIQHEKQTALFCTLLPWSPSHVDRNKKKCLWKLFLFPSNKCCILGFNSSVQRFFLATPLVTNSFCRNTALRAAVEDNLCSYHLFRAFLAVILSNGHTYFTWVCTFTKGRCLRTFAEAGLDLGWGVARGLLVCEKTTWDKTAFWVSSVKKQS